VIGNDETDKRGSGNDQGVHAEFLAISSGKELRLSF
jgi:hypothetical protein